MPHATSVYQALKRDPTRREAWVASPELVPNPDFVCFTGVVHKIWRHYDDLYETIGNAMPRRGEKTVHRYNLYILNDHSAAPKWFMSDQFWNPQKPNKQKKKVGLFWSWAFCAQHIFRSKKPNSWAQKAQWKTYAPRGGSPPFFWD